MVALTNYQITLIALMVACYLAICVRMALRMRRAGRNFWLWLAVTICFTGIPAVLVYFHDRMKQLQSPPRRRSRPAASNATSRCRHCGRRYRGDEVDDLDGVATCPNCHLPLDEVGIG